MRLLVGYASAHGSTREIAERIAGRLAAHGHRVETRPMVDTQGVDGYDAIVLGSAVHDQKWLPAATGFVHRNRAALAARPLFLFSVGMPGALRGRWAKLAMQEEPKVIADFRDAVRPRDHRLFTGVVRKQDLPPGGRLMFRAMGCRYGDHRDWARIEAWADEVAGRLADAQNTAASDSSEKRTPS